jgi:hypothetical protein
MGVQRLEGVTVLDDDNNENSNHHIHHHLHSLIGLKASYFNFCQLSYFL